MKPDWQWHMVNEQPFFILKAVRAEIVQITYKSRSQTWYMLADREATERILKEYEEAKKTEEQDIAPSDERLEEIPDDMFDIIEGFDDIKLVFKKALKVNSQVHILLVGPPATAKTLFLLEVARLKGAYYVLGGTTTKAGLIDALFTYKPRYILIDEIDKMNYDDFTALLSLMETGILKEVKYGKTREMKLNAKVFAACNRTNNIPPELLSRFMIFNVPEYDNSTLRRVIFKVVKEREKKSEEIAKAIADVVIDVLKTRDVRDAIKLARLSDTVEEVKTFAQIWKKYRGFKL